MRSTPLLILLFGATLLAGAAHGADGPAPAARRPALPPFRTLEATERAIPAAPPLQALVFDRGCATPRVSPADAEQVRAALGRWTDETPGPFAGGTIQVAFHVITAGGMGQVSDDQIAEQLRLLNQAFAPGGFTFALASVDRTENPEWFAMEPGSRRERDAKQALAADPAHRLNIYSCDASARVSGWTFLPWAAPESDLMHGVVLDHSSVAGGAAVGAGMVAIHQILHYLGLNGLELGLARNGSVADSDLMRAAVPLYRPSLFAAPVDRTATESEITPGAGSEPEDGRVLSYRGAFPNPFRAETALRFTLPAKTKVSLRIYSVTGQLVRTLVEATLPPGDHSAMFQAGDLPSGAYFSVLKAGRVQMNRTLVLVR